MPPLPIIERDILFQMLFFSIKPGNQTLLSADMNALVLGTNLGLHIFV